MSSFYDPWRKQTPPAAGEDGPKRGSELLRSDADPEPIESRTVVLGARYGVALSAFEWPSGAQERQAVVVSAATKFLRRHGVEVDASDIDEIGHELRQLQRVPRLALEMRAARLSAHLRSR